MHYHKWSITELDNMIPWEREVYVNMLLQELEIQRERDSQNV